MSTYDIIYQDFHANKMRGITNEKVAPLMKPYVEEITKMAASGVYRHTVKIGEESAALLLADFLNRLGYSAYVNGELNVNVSWA